MEREERCGGRGGKGRGETGEERKGEERERENILDGK